LTRVNSFKGASLKNARHPMEDFFDDAT